MDIIDMTKRVVKGYIRQFIGTDVYNEIVMLVMQWLVILVSNTIRLVANSYDHSRLFRTRRPQQFYFHSQRYHIDTDTRMKYTDTRMKYILALTKWGRFELYLTKQGELYLVLCPSSNIKFINLTIKTSEHRYQSKFHRVHKIDLFPGIDNAEWIGRLVSFYSQKNINTIMQLSDVFYSPRYREIILLHLMSLCLSEYYQQEMKKILWKITLDLPDIDYTINVQVPLYLQINYIEYINKPTNKPTNHHTILMGFNCRSGKKKYKNVQKYINVQKCVKNSKLYYRNKYAKRCNSGR